MGHPFDDLLRRFVGTAFSIRISRNVGPIGSGKREVLLHRNRRPQPSQGGHAEITLAEMRQRWGPGAYRIEMLNAIPNNPSDVDGFFRAYNAPPPHVHGWVIIRV